MRQTFRTPVLTRFWAWLLIVLGGFGVVDVFRRPAVEQSGWVAAAVVGVLVALSWMFALRPAVVVDDAALRLRNPLRDVTVPWSAVAGLESRYGLVVRTTAGRAFRAYALHARLRGTRRSVTGHDVTGAGRPVPAEVAASVARTSPTAYAVGVVQERWQQRRSRAQGTPSVRWAPDAIGPLLAAVAVLVIAVVG